MRGAAVAFGDRAVLRGIDLTVRRGEVVAVLGANGSGKSTLVRAVLGLVPLLAGTIEPVRRRPAGRELRRQWRRIGYVPQRLGAGGGVPATVTEVVSSGRLARRRLLFRRAEADRAAVEAALSAVGLADRAGDPVGTLSGGQQQRMLIARALAGRAGAADPRRADRRRRRGQPGGVRRRAARPFVAGGGTVLLVAHELGPLQPLVNRAVVMHDGPVVHDGAVAARRPATTPTRDHDHVHPHAPAPTSPARGAD